MKAFPSKHQLTPNDIYVETGMDLRDYFAAKAMQGFCANISRDLTLNMRHFVQLSYKVADEMMEARK